MKFITVTANPAIDLTIHANDWKPGLVNRGQHIDKTAGGKGISVAINLGDAGLEAIATGWMGAHNDSTFVEEFGDHQVIDQFIRIPGDTRRNFKIIDGNTGETTDINLPGQEIPVDSYVKLIEYLDENVDENSMLIMGGSLPPGISKAFYAEMTAKYKNKCRCVVVDTSDEALVETMKANILPHVIKPNIHELEALCGKELEDDEDIIEQARNFIARGVELVVVSMGSHGALFITKDRAVHAAPPRVKVVSTVGAGDSMVAGVVRGLSRGDDLIEIARVSTAYSAANIQHLGVGLPSQGALERLMKRVIVSEAGE